MLPQYRPEQLDEISGFCPELSTGGSAPFQTDFQ
jgi:hypothetical protein